jgi:hypothetical protein
MHISEVAACKSCGASFCCGRVVEFVRATTLLFGGWGGKAAPTIPDEFIGPQARPTTSA